MHRNIFLGITAWLLGAATATAGCLLAISLLGSGITTGGPGQLLSQDAANRELASEAAKSAPGTTPVPVASAEPDPTLATVKPSPVPSSASPPAAAAPDSPTADAPTAGVTEAAGAGPTDTAPSGSTPAGTVLASSAGTVVATCQSSGAYLISWSPQQGYEEGNVVRGPAVTASVQFESGPNEVTMRVSCSAGVPSATTTSSWGGDD